MTKNKENILQYLLKLIFQKDKDYIKKTTDYFNIANSTVYNYLKELKNKDIITKSNSDSFKYELVFEKTYFYYNLSDNLEEDRIFDKDIAPLLKEVSENVFDAWRYAFTEMMNNAIEHSKAKRIYCRVLKNYILTHISIIDDGIGIFKNIQQYMKEHSNKELELSECVSLLFAGKFTTAREAHSGEGIFFTSHLMDEFFISSDGKIFARDNFQDSLKDHIIPPTKINARTIVNMSLFNKSKKNLNDVFERFSDIETGFFKTHIPIAHIFMNGAPVSRSEAKRLGEMIKNFKEVNLDFKGVEQIGQAFTHELFIVWKRKNPDIKLNIENANENISNFIKRVINTKS